MNANKLLLPCLFSCILILLVQVCLAQTATIKGQIIDTETRAPIAEATAFIETIGILKETDKNGFFKISDLKAGSYNLLFFAEGYQSINKKVEINDQEVSIEIALEKLKIDLDILEVNASENEAYHLQKLNNVDGFGIYSTRKSEVIPLLNLTANLATNNARQVYKDIAGLNIWESDGGGLQLSIGARGLDPNRTSNFNTRQNGYDISADALGYPESYYTPPLQALERIEIVRGAASLQYGPQFGGLLNFVFKKGGKKPFEFVSENTVGSFGLLNTFNSIGGSKNGLNYYGFVQYKRGNSWRPNAKFEQKTAFASVSKEFSHKFKIGIEFTHTDYLAQQSGGLQDFQFQQDPRQSNRERNWFSVNWNLGALTMDYQISKQTKINNRSFFLSASRQSLGELGAINRPDPLRERDLIRGTFTNFGNETRLLHQYKINDQYTTFLIGARYYQGFTTSDQGDADDGSDANFQFLNPTELETASYVFPSRNASIFVENLFNINEKWSITPGLRFEYINTASEGYYKERVFSGGQVIFEQTFESDKNNSRSFLLAGLGVGYKYREEVELYSNFSQNYRSINFSDLAVVNPNLIVDTLLTDEKGFNIDIGMRGSALRNIIRFDASLFFLSYQDRIGVGEIIISDPSIGEKAVAYRTNIGDARIIGLETYASANLLELLQKSSDNFGCSVFVNFSLLHGKYTTGGSAIKGNDVELIPPFSLKTGINFNWKKLKIAYQFAYTGTHFSDATNATFVVDATRGLIPAYSIQDLSISYEINRFRFQAGINNLANAQYFTRRATSYPGPGIVPADARNFYFGVGVKL